MKKIIISSILGFILSSLFFLSQKKTIVYVKEPIEVEKIVEVKVPIEVQKIVYKKRSCKMSDTQKQKMCMEYISQLYDDQEQTEMESQSTDLSNVSNILAEEKPKNNRVSVHFGYGQSGFKSQFNGTQVNVEPTKGLVLGGQYQRKVADKWSASLLIQTNETLSLGAGYDY